jgi:hypothetical protein
MCRAHGTLPVFVSPSKHRPARHPRYQDRSSIGRVLRAMRSMPPNRFHLVFDFSSVLNEIIRTPVRRHVVVVRSPRLPPLEQR